MKGLADEVHTDSQSQDYAFKLVLPFRICHVGHIHIAAIMGATGLLLLHPLLGRGPTRLDTCSRQQGPDVMGQSATSLNKPAH